MNNQLTVCLGRVWVFIALIMLCLPLMIVAQSGMEDVVYLKNGGILRGQIIERVEGQSIKIEIVGGNVRVVNTAAIERIKREPIPSSTNYKKSGYVNQTGINILPGENSKTVRFQMVNGYRLSAKFSAGIGVGYVPYNEPLGLVPIFVEGRYQFRGANTSPFVFFRTGYGISVLADDDAQIEHHQGGLVVNPGIGIVFYTDGGLGWSFTAGLNIDHATYEQPGWGNQNVETKLVYQRLQLGISLSF